MRRLVAIISALVVTAALAGCGDDGSDLPAFTGEGGTAAPSASSTATPDPTGEAKAGGDLAAKGDKLGDGKNSITVGRVVRGDAEKEAVQQAYLRFWATRATALYRAKVDDAAVTAVSTGDAADAIVQSVRLVAGKKQHTEGGSTVNVQTVTVAGSKATLVDCFRDTSINMTASGKPAEQPDLAGLDVFEVELVKAGDAWKVSDVQKSEYDNCREK